MGAGLGGTNLPRIGQEVLVDFLGGDPDRPMITGRVYTNLQKTPYKLPGNKTQSGWKSNTSPTNGGYNELMFEDKQGQELVRMQAEKDHHTLVKNDQQHVVGRDRSRLVKRNEDVTIGKNRSHQVGENERVQIGQNQSNTVGVNRATQIGQIDSTLVGDTHVVMISPAGEAPPAKATSTTHKPNSIVHETAGGAKIEMIGSKIVLTADHIELHAAKGAVLQAKDGNMLILGSPKVKINP